MSTKWKVTIGLALAALAVAAVTFAAWPTLAQAQSATPAPQTTPGAPGQPHIEGRFRGDKVFIEATAQVTGLTVQEVATQLQSGQSLAQIAESKGKTAEEVITAARTHLQDMLKQAITAGRLTQTQADAKLAEFDQTASQMMSDTTLGQRLGAGRGRFGHGDRFGFEGHDGNSLITATTSVTGLTAPEVMTQLQSGQSLAQIAESKGKTADEVIQAARTQLQDMLKQVVTAGRLTQAQADAKLAEFDQSASKVMKDTTLGQRSGFGQRFGHGGRFGSGFGFEFRPRGGNSLIGATASVTGLTEQEVMTQLQSGQSLTQIAESKGKTADDVISAARTQLQDMLKQAVTAGRLTQAQADAKLAEFDQTAPQIMNSTDFGSRFGQKPFKQPMPDTPVTPTGGNDA